MQPRVVQVGPLVAPTATNIALAQSPIAAGALALNGAAGGAVANNICLSQNGTAATALIINGALKQARFAAPTSGVAGAVIAVLPVISPIYITSAGNDNALTWAVIGMDRNNAALSETISGANAGVSASANSYKSILSITPSGNTASTVTVGAMGLATLDTARRVLFTSSGTDTGLTISISGTDWAGVPISETLIGGSSGTPVYTVLDYLTVTHVSVSGATAGTISVGTNGVASSQWINLDTFAMGTVNIQAVASGTVNYTVETTNDDPASYGNPIARSVVTWDAASGGLINQTLSASYGFPQTPLYMRVLLNSNTNPGYVRMTAVQHLSA